MKFFFLLLPLYVLATPFYESYQQYKKGNYFTALDIIAKEYKYAEPNKKVKRYISSIVKHTGTHYFETFRDIELRKVNIPSTHLVMAKRNLYLKKYKYAFKRLNRIPKSSRFYPEAILIKATSNFSRGRYQTAFKQFKKCSEVAYEREKFFSGSVMRYYAIIKETCTINIARIFFNNKRYKEALKLFERIPKNSFLWPTILLEKAWSYYHIEKFNKTLGLLMTYNSPLLASYFDPEVEILKGLAYYKLCQYSDALKVVDNYYNDHREVAFELRKIIERSKKKPNYFFEVMKMPSKELEKINPFIAALKTKTTKRLKYNLSMNTIIALDKEIKSINKPKQIQRLRRIRKELVAEVNHYGKVSFYRFLNKINEHSENLFALKLEVLSNAREQLYEGVNRATEKRGSEKNIKRADNQEYWEFREEFWADELGDYSFALDSKCKLKKKKNNYDI